MDILITEHAKERARKRLGIKEKSLYKMAVRAYLMGLKHSKTKGQLHKYLDKKYFEYKRKGNNMRVYGETLYIFRNKTLITLFKLPTELKKYIKL